MKKVSIIITCYNLGEFLQEALDSIINYPVLETLEIIIINDGSTEIDTKRILNKITYDYPNVLVVNQENQGLAKARNNGIKLAKGEYIIPLDVDNKLRHGFIKKAIKSLDNNLDIEVVHGNAQFFGKRQGLWKVNPLDIKSLVLNNDIDACACFRKTTWEEFNGYDEQMPIMGFEDWDLWLRFAAKGKQFQYVDDVFFDYRVREHSMLTNAWSNRDMLIEYIFNKKELKHLGLLRELLIENEKLKEEPATKEVLAVLKKKVFRKINNIFKL
ncbi:glycosyltransferase [Bizionia gelidisalsuginis]|uniref:Glycosyltransferase n=1 Tax=Bizionia gelidisalsuginis TaxID=291188 RepID=A0ABY3MDD7_9FLAO|nr:glycosyltransferase [Bizionia gelidisalsuginis]TYC17013.1 glycosyltransferase [Bizionia gelidisalsuginis]